MYDNAVEINIPEGHPLYDAVLASLRGKDYRHADRWVILSNNETGEFLGALAMTGEVAVHKHRDGDKDYGSYMTTQWSLLDRR